MSLSEFAVRGQLRRLEGAYNPPQADAGRILETWREVLGDLTEAELADAVGAYLKSDRAYFPKPGQLRALAMQARGVDRNTATTVLENPDGSCAVCGAPVELLTPDGQPLPKGMDAAAARARYGHRHVRMEHDRTGAPMWGRFSR